MLLTLKGTPFIYYGQEIGMRNGKIPRKSIQDSLGKRFWPFYSGRDQARTPMQWNGKPFAGFSKSTPWLPVNKDFKLKNVALQKKQPNSLLNHYKTLIQIRRNNKALTHGNLEIIPVKKWGILLYMRTYQNQELLIAINFLPIRRSFPESLVANKQIIYTTKSRKNTKPNNQLTPFEGSIYRTSDRSGG